MIDWRALSATRQVAILRSFQGATPEWDVLPVACRREGLAAVWLRRDTGAVQLLLTPWWSLSEWVYQGEREMAPVPALDREIERGRVGVWGRGELALAEALVVAWHLASPIQIVYRKQEQLGSAGETRRITPTALFGASIRAFDHGKSGPRVFRFQGIDALEIVRDSVGVAWDGQGYALTGRAA